MRQVVILAAGEGTRMKSKTIKVLHPLAGAPVLDHVFSVAESLNPARTILVKGSSLGDYTKEGVEYVIQNPACGTGDAVKYALPLLEKEGDVLVLFGDTPLITQETLEAMLAVREENPEVAVVVLGMRPDKAQGYARLVVDAHGLQRIVEFKDCTEEEKENPLCNSGVMLLNSACLEELLGGLTTDNAAGEYYLTDCVAVARSMGKTCAVVEGDAEEFLGINTRQDLANAEAILQKRLRRKAMAQGVTMMDPSSVYLSHDTKLAADVTLYPHVFFGPGVSIKEDATVYPYCHLENTTLEKGAKVGPFARLRGNAHVYEKAEVGNFVEVKNSTFHEGAKAKHLSYIGDAEIGKKSNIGAGTITCNYDGYKKSKTNIGEGVLVGSNASLIAPLNIGDGAIVGAGSVITQDVPKDAIVVERSDQQSFDGASIKYRQRRSEN